MDEAILEEVGFTRGESQVYRALLRLGEANVTSITRSATVSRSKVYDILEKLKRKGVVSESIRKKTRFFQAADPERIVDYLSEREKQIQEKKERLKKALPDIRGMAARTEQQEVRVYTGYEGVKTFYRETISSLQPGDEWLVITMDNRQWRNKAFSIFFKGIHLQRLEKRLDTKVLIDAKTLPFRERGSFPDSRHFRMRAVHAALPSGLVIVKDKVSITTWGATPRVFVIVCREVAQMYRSFFYGLWKKAKAV
ncbi:MAG TPA: helix-turn-helix domain-containing protein [Candidatus Nanoarchaeia archaeon]|nr:helix-turn-helix domain-containing protein [Candidatus Nanoarchaeia archaeon]